MSANKRVPRCLQRYVVQVINGKKNTFRYFTQQREATAWARSKRIEKATKRLFKIDYDFYGEIK